MDSLRRSLKKENIRMKKLIELLAIPAIALAFVLSSANVAAQPGPGGPGGFDPRQFQQMIQQRMMDFIRERLVVTNDQEWKIIEDRLSKVMQARMDSMFTGLSGFAGMGFGRGGEGGQGRRLDFGPPSPEADAVQKAIESNAPASEIKAKLERLREARRNKEAELARLRQQLREVLSLKQEANLVLMGVLD